MVALDSPELVTFDSPEVVTLDSPEVDAPKICFPVWKEILAA